VEVEALEKIAAKDEVDKAAATGCRGGKGCKGALAKRSIDNLHIQLALESTGKT
jgi:hypothetical protein